MIVNIILAFPVALGIVLLLLGVALYIRRLKFGIHTVGVITGIDKSSRKKARIKIDVEAPIVRYKINGREYNCPAEKYQTEGVSSYKKGQKINIRVNRKNPRIFNPVSSGSVWEMFFIFGGIFIIIAYVIMYVRYF